jgi:hypothetical protein
LHYIHYPALMPPQSPQQEGNRPRAKAHGAEDGQVQGKVAKAGTAAEALPDEGSEWSRHASERPEKQPAKEQPGSEEPPSKKEAEGLAAGRQAGERLVTGSSAVKSAAAEEPVNTTIKGGRSAEAEPVREATAAAATPPGAGEDGGEEQKPARPRRGYVCRRFGHGYYTFDVSGWKAFIDEVAPKFIGSADRFVWRGARNPAWPLQSSLTRSLDRLKEPKGKWEPKVSDLTTNHVIQFLNDLRGLRHLKPAHDRLYRKLEEHASKQYSSFRTVLQKLTQAEQHLLYEVFSLGQHHGLHTPFLDWTDAPLIALYFAFSGDDDHTQPPGVGNRVVYALNHKRASDLCKRGEANNDDSILFLDSMAHDNPRILGQAGSFTFIPAHLPVEEWVVKYVEDRCEERPMLLRFLIANEGRAQCLLYLRALNIHARALFPDLQGAAQRSNEELHRQVSA